MLLDILQLTHELLSKDLIIDSFNLMLNEMQENVSLVSYSSRLASQVCQYLFQSCVKLSMADTHIYLSLFYLLLHLYLSS